MSKYVPFLANLVVPFSVGLAGCSLESREPTEPEAAEVGKSSSSVRESSLDVSFGDCSELASITTISVSNARTIVPNAFVLAGDASGTPFVVRVARCNAVSVDGSAPEAGTVAQLGVSIVSPDGTGDINNYTAWYYTTSRRLAWELDRLGVPAQYVPDLAYTVSGGALTIDVDAPGHPKFDVDAPIVEPGAFAIPFHANWWKANGNTVTKMSTPIPSIRFGGATATLHTAPLGQLGRVLESSTETFALLDSFNRFASAPMTVTRHR